jgi:predicted enzyme related to lactoylglutathione lyase
MARVTGIGGIFFKARQTDALARWYRERLGVGGEPWGGHVFHWRPLDAPDKRGYSVWSTFPEDAGKFDGSAQPFMINYRVDDLVTQLDELQAAGVTVVGELEEHENGKFAWVVDPEGQKIELWEPVDSDKDPYLP